MGARSGQDYLDSLRAAQPTVYVSGQRVDDVTEHPAFRGPLRSVMEQYDMQLDPAYRDVCLYESPTTGDPVSVSFLQPRSRQDLVKKRQHFKLRADQNFGLMGRSPDFMNAFVTWWPYSTQQFAATKPEYGDNAHRYYEQMRERDAFMTHMLINPQVDRSKTSANQEDPFLHLARVGETAEGLVVRGAKMLGTMAPITEEVVVIPYGGVAPGDDAYALTFGIPSNTPGLTFVCREPFSVGRSSFDHPLSSRFEEMDCIAIFDDVVVPWNRVMVDGSPGSAAVINAMPADPRSGILNQTSARLLSSMEFLCGLATKVADAIGITGFLHVQEKLGEMLSWLEMMRAVFYGAEAMANELPDGSWMPYMGGLFAFHLQAGKVHARYVEIIQTLAGGGFFYAPSGADFDNPELRPYLDKYARGRPGVSAEERVKLFKLAWDATGDAFGQRVQQYVRFYSGDPIRNTAGFYLAYDTEPLFQIVDRALAGVDHDPIPLSPEVFSNPGPRSSRPTGLSGAYPASSHPSPVRTTAQ
jgi:anthranilate 3-monooxygenase (FAD) / 4-hydroxyphenylacetate 3-monooxygenase